MTESSRPAAASAALAPLPEQPLVSIVTPSFNQAQFLRASIDSVLAQTYPHVDYLVVDGGSTDGSLEVLRSFGDRVRWISEQDDGQSDAIAKGFERTSGEILTWINSDDALLPDGVAIAVEAFRRNPTAGLVYSNGPLLDDSGAVTGPFPWIEPFDLWRLVNFSDFILQPSALFRREAYERIGGLDRGLHFAMDWDLWIRLAGTADVVYLDQVEMGCSRVWNDTKTATGGWRRIAELARLAKRHTGRYDTPAVKRYALDTLGRQLRERLPRSLFRLAVAIGAWVDGRILRRMPAHADGWLGPRGQLLFPRRWGRVVVEVELPRLPRDRRNRLKILVDGQREPTGPISAPGVHRIEIAVQPDPASPLCEVELLARDWIREPRSGRRLATRLLKLAPLA